MYSSLFTYSHLCYTIDTLHENKEHYPDEKPIVMICSCKKYINYLHAAIKRFTHPSWTVIGIIGGSDKTIYDEQTHILSLSIGDVYEKLPSKIHAGIEWIYTTYPRCKGIFKTDDDMKMDINALATILVTTNQQYMGLVVAQCNEDKINKDRISTRFQDTSLEPTHQKAHYCYGAGYWLHRSIVPFIINEKEIYEHSVLEDVCTGYVLNRYEVYPKPISIWYEECPRTEELLLLLLN